MKNTIAGINKETMKSINAESEKIEAIALRMAASPCHLGTKEDAYRLASLALDELNRFPPPISNLFVEAGCELFDSLDSTGLKRDNEEG